MGDSDYNVVDNDPIKGLSLIGEGIKDFFVDQYNYWMDPNNLYKEINKFIEKNADMITDPKEFAKKLFISMSKKSTKDLLVDICTKGTFEYGKIIAGFPTTLIKKAGIATFCKFVKETSDTISTQTTYDRNYLQNFYYEHFGGGREYWTDKASDWADGHYN